MKWMELPSLPSLQERRPFSDATSTQQTSRNSVPVAQFEDEEYDHRVDHYEEFHDEFDDRVHENGHGAANGNMVIHYDEDENQKKNEEKEDDEAEENVEDEDEDTERYRVVNRPGDDDDDDGTGHVVHRPHGLLMLIRGYQSLPCFSIQGMIRCGCVIVCILTAVVTLGTKEIDKVVEEEQQQLGPGGGNDFYGSAESYFCPASFQKQEAERRECHYCDGCFRYQPHVQLPPPCTGEYTGPIFCLGAAHSRLKDLSPAVVHHVAQSHWNDVRIWGSGFERDPCFAYHEFIKHGTCAYGANYEAYLADVRSAYYHVAATRGFEYFTQQTYIWEPPFAVNVSTRDLALLFLDDTAAAATEEQTATLLCDAACNVKAVRVCFTPHSTTGRWTSKRTACPTRSGATTTTSSSSGDVDAFHDCALSCPDFVFISSLDCNDPDPDEEEDATEEEAGEEEADETNTTALPEPPTDETLPLSILYPPDGLQGGFHLFGAPMGTHDLFEFEVRWIGPPSAAEEDQQPENTWTAAASAALPPPLSLNFAYQARHFVTHGLWPRYRTLRNCSQVMTNYYSHPKR